MKSTIVQIATISTLSISVVGCFIYAFSSEVIFNDKCLARSTATTTYVTAWHNGQQVCNKLW